MNTAFCKKEEKCDEIEMAAATVYLSKAHGPSKGGCQQVQFGNTAFLNSSYMYKFNRIARLLGRGRRCRPLVAKANLFFRASVRALARATPHNTQQTFPNMKQIDNTQSIHRAYLCGCTHTHRRRTVFRLYSLYI